MEMDFWDSKNFKAIYDSGELIEWLLPQTYSHVVASFKDFAFGCAGILLKDNLVIKTTGNKEKAEEMIKYYNLERA